MKIEKIYLHETDSTNVYLQSQSEQSTFDIIAVRTDYQTAGKGMGTNTWESERGKNLLCSLLIQPQNVSPSDQFIISMASAIAQREVLAELTDGICIKWPNDIYWHDHKLGGTRIDTSLSGSTLKNVIIGTGININQRSFHSDAPNPVSLYQIIDQETDIDQIFNDLIAAFEKRYDQVLAGQYNEISTEYHKHLYRLDIPSKFNDKDGDFIGTIKQVARNGHLIIVDQNNREREYDVKEVRFLLH